MTGLFYSKPMERKLLSCSRVFRVIESIHTIFKILLLHFPALKVKKSKLLTSRYLNIPFYQKKISRHNIIIRKAVSFKRKWLLFSLWELLDRVLLFTQHFISPEAKKSSESIQKSYHQLTTLPNSLTKPALG